MGAPGSPYTRKMLSLLRFRHIPYQLLIGDQSVQIGLPKPKVSLLPTFYLPNDKGEVEAVVDSTPLIRRFEAEFSERSVIPQDPVMTFLNYLLEDYGDEWLTKAMFHYRWYYDDDIDKAGKILPRWRNLSTPDESLVAMSKMVSERQIARLYVVGSNDITAPVIEDSYHRFLAIFDRVIQKQPFLMGQRPGSADFAFYAQLTQLAKFDPTPAQICLEKAPRIYAWTDVVDDLSGNAASEDGWLTREQAKSVLGDLLAEVGRVYVPAMIANAEALMAGRNQMETSIDGKPWIQPAFPYQGKCLQWVRQEYAALEDEERSVVDEILAGTGCQELFR
jgi:glutathione S-transferase|tara:strand:+ start:556 stop:1557 length:1002 start_codon:yes stop_codon:yes gene_type:complete